MTDEINSKHSIKLFSAVGFGRSEKDGEREKMLDPVNYGEDEEEGWFEIINQYALYFT